jgi:hypothetical protein
MRVAIPADVGCPDPAFQVKSTKRVATRERLASPIPELGISLTAFAGIGRMGSARLEKLISRRKEKHMGADSVYFYYGIRRTIAAEDEEQIEQLEDESHPIFNLAFNHTLHVAWGCLTDGAETFLLIGSEIGRFGVEGIHEKKFTDAQLLEMVGKTNARLKAAGITESPGFYVQLQAQY